jgi:hypothetical protein
LRFDRSTCCPSLSTALIAAVQLREAKEVDGCSSIGKPPVCGAFTVKINGLKARLRAKEFTLEPK